MRIWCALVRPFSKDFLLSHRIMQQILSWLLNRIPGPWQGSRHCHLDTIGLLWSGISKKDGEDIYSSYALIEEGKIVHNYRRISKNWKDYEITNEHYREGTDTKPFQFRGVEMNIALCGDLWIYPEAFRSSGLLIWPVYVNFDLDEEESAEYAKQAASVCGKTLLVNPLSKDPLSRGGAFFFANGKVEKRIGLDEEKVLVVEIRPNV